ncbi:MAG TPA: nucleotide exchange factor GrpE [Tepidisphaeraceae bacterium]|jgi:molecular chaperone GrpE
MTDDNIWTDNDLDENDATDRDSGSNAEAAGDLDVDLRKLQEERDRLFQQLARVSADFKNAQRRLELDKQQAIQFANTGLIKSLLPILDNFERALEVDPAKTDVATLLKGMQIVHDQLVKTLVSQNVEVIAPEAGTPFDPKMHEALMQQPSDKYHEPTVLQLLQKGYGMQDRVLRPAQVIVSNSQ